MLDLLLQVWLLALFSMTGALVLVIAVQASLRAWRGIRVRDAHHTERQLAVPAPRQPAGSPERVSA